MEGTTETTRGDGGVGGGGGGGGGADDDGMEPAVDFEEDVDDRIVQEGLAFLQKWREGAT